VSRGLTVEQGTMQSLNPARILETVTEARYGHCRRQEAAGVDGI
jgi:hypothetical protein